MSSIVRAVCACGQECDAEIIPSGVVTKEHNRWTSEWYNGYGHCDKVGQSPTYIMIAPELAIVAKLIVLPTETPCPFCNGSGPGDLGVQGCASCGGTNRVVGPAPDNRIEGHSPSPNGNGHCTHCNAPILMGQCVG